ncbi:hypothetical protein F5887DRAFT_914219 [Amanita rubescens]|nr:hypothetical protein F5887DRAFT_914219 [Amanita rubescens]
MLMVKQQQTMDIQRPTNSDSSSHHGKNVITNHNETDNALDVMAGKKRKTDLYPESSTNGAPPAARAVHHYCAVALIVQLSGWVETDAMTNCYDRCIPINALLGASMFNVKKPEEHFLPHDILATEPGSSPRAPSLLIWLQKVLLNDTAVLFKQNPTCPLFQSPLFRNPSFQQFAAASKSALAQAEEDMLLNIQNLPSQFAAPFKASWPLSTSARTLHSQMRSIIVDSSYVKSISKFQAGLGWHAGADDLPGGCSWHAFNGKRTSTSAGCSCSPSSAAATTTITTSSSILPCSSPPPPPPPPELPMPTLIQSAANPDTGLQAQRWKDLTSHFPHSQLLKHNWEWASNNFLPVYVQSRWTRTENCCQKKMITLMESLLAKPHWDAEQALQFLHEEYEAKKAIVKCSFLTHHNGIGEGDLRKWVILDIFFTIQLLYLNNLSALDGDPLLYFGNNLNIIMDCNLISATISFLGWLDKVFHHWGSPKIHFFTVHQQRS